MRFAHAVLGRVGPLAPTAPPLPPVLIDTTATPAGFAAAPWSANALAVAASGVAGPGGSSEATRITAAGGGYNLLQRIGQNGFRRVRAVVRAGSAKRFTLSLDAPGFTAAWFDLTAGTIGADGFGGARITALGSGWFETEISAVCSGNLHFGVANADGSPSADAGDTVLVFSVSLFST